MTFADARQVRHVLAIDTSFESCSVAVGLGLGTPDCRIVSRFEPMNTGQAERVMPMTFDLLAEAQIDRGDIDLVAVTTGPGSFTGTRIGIAAAKGIAIGLGVPVAGLTSLQVIARQAVLAGLGGGVERQGACDICVAVDMGRVDVYAQVFDAEALVARLEPTLVNALNIEEFAAQHGAMLFGRGDRFGSRGVLTSPICLPRAETLVVLVTQCEVINQDVLPLYLRPPNAKPRRERGDGATGRLQESHSKPEGLIWTPPNPRRENWSR